MKTERPFDKNRRESMLWWTRLNLEEQFYAVIPWLESQGKNVTEIHPHHITPEQIQEIWERETGQFKLEL